MDYFYSLHPVIQAMIATLFTWGMTALGAALVFTTKNFNQQFFGQYVRVCGRCHDSASFWSLLSPALEMAEASGKIAWIPAAIGFMAGGHIPLGD